MWFIVGLGNPGSEYEQTRHNAGFKLVDFWSQARAQESGQALPAAKLQKKLQTIVTKQADWVFGKPQTFMNASGQAVRALLDFYVGFDHQSPSAQAEILRHLVVVHDDLDLEFGKCKLQFGRGPKIHNGLLSIYQHLGTQEFWHGRVGIDGRGTDRKLPAKNYVLLPWTVEEQMAWQQWSPAVLKLWQQRLITEVGAES
jgi:PTH1 family peptidyl-tRNA hydrolase